ILGRGSLTKKLTIEIPALSESAKKAILKAGGKIEAK
ncbi:ribosomal L18e/L15 family protein, partial [Chlamydia psittaci 02DC18]